MGSASATFTCHKPAAPRLWSCLLQPGGVLCQHKQGVRVSSSTSHTRTNACGSTTDYFSRMEILRLTQSCSGALKSWAPSFLAFSLGFFCYQMWWMWEILSLVWMTSMAVLNILWWCCLCMNISLVIVSREHISLEINKTRKYRKYLL